MTSLNGIAVVVDTIGCRNFNLTHKKVMYILPRNKTFFYTFLKTCWFNKMSYTNIGISLKCINS